jgi:hypothetical protein
MKFSEISICIAGYAAFAGAVPSLNKRAAQFDQGQPIDATGKGGPILGKLYDMSTVLILTLNRWNKQTNRSPKP